MKYIFKNGGVLFIVLSVITQTLFATTSIDKNLDVGTIDGTHAVNLSGAFTYTIPIKIPEGTMGMQPNLSLNYNSQGGNGIAGYGWSLSGVSAISRVNKNIHNDDAVAPIYLSNSDVFTLDGNRLIGGSGIRDINNNIVWFFRTEMESFQQITATGESRESFTVKTKDGKTIEYGQTNDSKLMTEDGTIALMWYLNKVTDRNGNFMTYHYEAKGRQVVLSRIEYTGNGTTKPYTKVKFTYVDRLDKSNAYMATSKIENNVILDNIEIITNFTQHYKSYKLVHAVNQFSYLTEFQEWGIKLKEDMTDVEKTMRLNSLTFDYGESASYSAKNFFLSNNDFGDLANRDIIMLPGNFNGDGLQDFLTIKYARDGKKGKYTGINLMLNNNKKGLTGFSTLDLTDEIVESSGNFSFMRYLSPSNIYRKNFDKKALQPVEGIRILTGDLNGDNIDDIIIYDNDILTYRYFESTGVGKYNFVNDKEFKVDAEHNATLADVDGDGLLELFILDRANDKNNIYLKSFDDRYDLHCSNFRSTAKFFANSTNMLPKDIDGDGKRKLNCWKKGLLELFVT